MIVRFRLSTTELNEFATRFVRGGLPTPEPWRWLSSPLGGSTTSRARRAETPRRGRRPRFRHRLGRRWRHGLQLGVAPHMEGAPTPHRGPQTPDLYTWPLSPRWTGPARLYLGSPPGGGHPHKGYTLRTRARTRGWRRAWQLGVYRRNPWVYAPRWCPPARYSPGGGVKPGFPPGGGYLAGRPPLEGPTRANQLYRRWALLVHHRRWTTMWRRRCRRLQRYRRWLFRRPARAMEPNRRRFLRFQRWRLRPRLVGVTRRVPQVVRCPRLLNRVATAERLGGWGPALGYTRFRSTVAVDLNRRRVATPGEYNLFGPDRPLDLDHRRRSGRRYRLHEHPRWGALYKGWARQKRARLATLQVASEGDPQVAPTHQGPHAWAWWTAAPWGRANFWRIRPPPRGARTFVRSIRSGATLGGPTPAGPATSAVVQRFGLAAEFDSGCVAPPQGGDTLSFRWGGHPIHAGRAHSFLAPPPGGSPMGRSAGSTPWVTPVESGPPPRGVVTHHRWRWWRPVWWVYYQVARRWNTLLWRVYRGVGLRVVRPRGWRRRWGLRLRWVRLGWTPLGGPPLGALTWRALGWVAWWVTRPAAWLWTGSVLLWWTTYLVVATLWEDLVGWLWTVTFGRPAVRRVLWVYHAWLYAYNNNDLADEVINLEPDVETPEWMEEDESDAPGDYGEENDELGVYFDHVPETWRDSEWDKDLRDYLDEAHEVLSDLLLEEVPYYVGLPLRPWWDALFRLPLWGLLEGATRVGIALQQEWHLCWGRLLTRGDRPGRVVGRWWKIPLVVGKVLVHLGVWLGVYTGLVHLVSPDQLHLWVTYSCGATWYDEYHLVWLALCLWGTIHLVGPYHLREYLYHELGLENLAFLGGVALTLGQPEEYYLHRPISDPHRLWLDRTLGHPLGKPWWWYDFRMHEWGNQGSTQTVVFPDVYRSAPAGYQTLHHYPGWDALDSDPTLNLNPTRMEENYWVDLNEIHRNSAEYTAHHRHPLYYRSNQMVQPAGPGDEPWVEMQDLHHTGLDPTQRNTRLHQQRRVGPG